VINHSIAGVALGQSVGAAKRAWKGDVTCRPQGDAAACKWGSATKGGHLSFSYARGINVILQTSIVATARHGQNIFRKPLTTVKTTKGIGLGSKLSAVKRAYPGGSSQTYRYDIARGKLSTSFLITADHRVAAMIIEQRYVPRSRHGTLSLDSASWPISTAGAPTPLAAPVSAAPTSWR
jgi:hypothetical protein